MGMQKKRGQMSRFSEDVSFSSDPDYSYLPDVRAKVAGMHNLSTDQVTSLNRTWIRIYSQIGAPFRCSADAHQQTPCDVAGFLTLFCNPSAALQHTVFSLFSRDVTALQQQQKKLFSGREFALQQKKVALQQQRVRSLAKQNAALQHVCCGSLAAALQRALQQLLRLLVRRFPLYLKFKCK